MRTLLIVSALLLSSYTNGVKAQGWEWASGGTGDSEGLGVAVDRWGNSFVSGYSKGILNFSGVTLSSLGTSAIIIAKYDAAGNLKWAEATHNGFSRPISLTTDDSGNLFVLGYYTSATLDIGSFTLTNPGGTSQICLIKFSAGGSVQFAVNLFPGYGPGSIVIHGAVVFVSASFRAPSISVGGTILNNTDPSGTTDDVAIVKMDLAGNILSAKNFGGSGSDNGLLAVTSSGDCYLSGTTASPSLAFGSVSVTNMDTSLYLVKFDSLFNGQWVKNQQGIGKIGSFVSCMVTDEFENVFITGSWRPTAYFGSEILPADTVSNIYLVKYDGTGSMNWLARATGNGQLYGYSVAVDNCDNVWISGGMGDQQPGHHGSHYVKINGVRIDTPAGAKDPAFIAEWTNSGTYVRTAMLQTGGDDNNYIASDGTGNIYFGSDYWIGPYTIGHSTVRDPKQPSEDMFVVKYAFPKDTTYVNTLVCMQDSALLQVTPGYEVYTWDNGSLQTQRSVFTIGNYVAYGTGRCGSGVLKQTFTVDHGKLDTAYARTDTSACLHAHTILSAPAGYRAYLWSDGNTSPNDIVDTAGVYLVIAAGTCTVPTLFDTFYVDNNNIDLAFSLGNDTDVCAPLQISVPLSGVSYLWQDGSGADHFLATESGTFSVKISERSCFNADSIDVRFVDVSQHLSDTILCREHPAPVTLKANIPQSASKVSILWSTGSTQPEITVSNAGNYWVMVTDDGCSASDTMLLDVMFCSCNASMPAAFTPNGDGNNDVFYPLLDKACSVYDYTFAIFDRWGNRIFGTHDRNAGWDGTFHGVPQDLGTYMYFVAYRVGDVFHKHMLKGDVVLIR